MNDIERLKADHHVLLFSKSYCLYCLEVMRTLTSWGITYHIVQLDRVSGALMKATLKELKEIGGFSTVPHLFIDGKSVGDCSNIKAGENTLNFQIVASKYINWDKVAQVHEMRVENLGYLFFPETVNGNVVQMGGVLTNVYVILLSAYWQNTKVQPWAVLALAIDFGLRTFGGSVPSIIGMIAVSLVAPFPPRWVAGINKQFANLIGFIMSTVAAGLCLGGYPQGGLAILLALYDVMIILCSLFTLVILYVRRVLASGLQGYLNFCLGCWMFKYFYEFGLVGGDVLRPFASMKWHRKWAFDYINEKRSFPKEIQSTHVLLPGQTMETPVDLIRKDRQEFEYVLFLTMSHLHG